MQITINLVKFVLIKAQSSIFTMKNLVILFLLMSVMGGVAAETMENSHTDNLVGYWMLSIAGSSALVWLIVRFLYRGSKASNGNP